MQIDRKKVIRTFQDYVDNYNSQDAKVRLKIEHTYRVSELCESIAQSLHLDAKNCSLAWLLGMLHDIGRFEQLRLTNSFDDSVIPHAKCSLMVLFDQGHLRDFIETKEYDAIIYESIKNHGVFLVDENLKGEELLFTKIIRDGDKLDNFHTKLIESMETMLDVTMEELEAEEVSDYAYETFMDGRPLLNSKRETHLDMWVSYIGYMFDLNLPQSFAYVREHDYINRLVDRVAYKNPKAEQRMENIREKMIQFVGKK